MENEGQAIEAAEVYTFDRPVTYEGTEYKTLTLDFDKLIGEDLLACDRQYRAEQRNNALVSPELDRCYQAYVIAKASGVQVGRIRAASAKDFTRLTLRARDFLLL